MIKANISWSAKQIAKAVELGSMTFDNAIQRGLVWDVNKKSLLIDSLLRNFPVPPMYTIKTDIDAPEGCKKGSKVFDCIDGKQRCEAIWAFRNNEFPLVGCEPFVDLNGEDIDLNGKYYDDLDEDMRDAFDGYTLTVYFFTDITDDEIAEMMARLNNGKPLSGIENARIKAKNLPAITRLAKHKLFTENMSNDAINGYNNEDVVIKTALQVFEEQFELSTKNVKGTYEGFDFSDEQTDILEKIFDKTYEVVCEMKNNTKKSIVKKALKKTNFVSVIFFVSQNVNEYSERMAGFLAGFFDVKDDTFAKQREIYNDACTNGTNHANNVVIRNDAVAEGYNVFRNSN